MSTYEKGTCPHCGSGAGFEDSQCLMCGESRYRPKYVKLPKVEVYDQCIIVETDWHVEQGGKVVKYRDYLEAVNALEDVVDKIVAAPSLTEKIKRILARRPEI